MFSFLTTPLPKRPPVTTEKIRICVTGFGLSHNTGRAQKLAAVIAAAHPDQYETWFYFSTFGFKSALQEFKTMIPKDQLSKKSTMDSDKQIKDHSSAPFVWLERKDKPIEVLGGRDMFCDWAAKKFPEEESILKLTSLESPPLSEVFFDNATPGGTWMES